MREQHQAEADMRGLAFTEIQRRFDDQIVRERQHIQILEDQTAMLNRNIGLIHHMVGQNADEQALIRQTQEITRNLVMAQNALRAEDERGIRELLEHSRRREQAANERLQRRQRRIVRVEEVEEPRVPLAIEAPPEEEAPPRRRRREEEEEEPEIQEGQL